MDRIVLRPGRERSLARRHPWVFSGAITYEPQEAGLRPGSTIEVKSAGGEVLGYGSWSPTSQIRVRMRSDADLL